jgi:predicted metal-dependent hydrolase
MSQSNVVVDAYIQHYPASLRAQVAQLVADNRLGDYLAERYPAVRHTVQSDPALYEYAQQIKKQYMRQVASVDKVLYDARLDVLQHALGLNTAISRIQGGKLKAKKEIRIAGLFKAAPEAFLQMIVVHELAHLRVRDHDKAFYQLCQHMLPDYHQLEFDLRLWLIDRHKT